MRIHLAGSFVDLKPVVLMYTDPGSHSFDKTLYPDHTIFDVMVIGAGGGYGGGMAGVDPTSSHHVTMYGGGGGGGGSHRVRGLMDYLDASTDIVVGAGGTDGADGDDTTPGDDGTDGGPSKFGSIVLATGGMGGKGVQTIDSADDPLSDGGEGGVGGTESWDAGGGAVAGVAGKNVGGPIDGQKGWDGGLYQGPITIYPPGSSTSEQSLEGIIGMGGGGGGGGLIRHVTVDDTYVLEFPFATQGGRGSYNLDEPVFSPLGRLVSVQPAGAPKFYKGSPGRGGGARVTPFNRSNVTFGDGRLNRNGLVIIRLTVE